MENDSYNTPSDSTTRFSSLPTSSLPPQSQQSGFSALYPSIFPPKSPHQKSPSRYSSGDDCQNTFHSCSYSSIINVENRLQQASLVLEYQQLCERHDLCHVHLQDLVEQVASLRRENAALRSANKELVKLLSLSSQAVMHNCRRRVGHSEANRTETELGVDEVSGYSPTSIMVRGQLERVWLPKSISIRLSGYQKVSQPGNGHDCSSGSSQSANQPKGSAANEPEIGKVQQAAKKEEAFEVYSQGMFKTELCNKWQETGCCPYGSNCQFAHGIAELRPVSRHPKYKTEVCRMVLAGDSCPYGHRCHFRHST